MIEVTLTWAECLLAAQVGAMRYVQNLKLGRRDKHGCGLDSGWVTHIEGAAGEMALAKLTGMFWSGALGDLHADDVGQLQVRTRSSHKWDLILHRDDEDDRPFILLTGRTPTFAVRGWILGRDGKQEKWWSDPAGGRPAFFVPQSALQEISSLLELRKAVA